jgi:diaminohydroxyphosphoribosylaminopyrimidine deaminase/5-amino-6-(5-phosphoribosylamino)uracil reductase
LEPCAHRGRTPPCVDAIIEAGISRVVIGTLDPNPLVNGKGAALLEDAGIAVKIGILEHMCREIILPYWVATVKGRPFVHLKLAMSADGKIAPAKGPTRWLTGVPARRYAHRLRRRYDAVLVGVETVLKDDPALNVRLGSSNPPQPLPVVLDSRARLPTSSKLVARKLGGKAPLVLCSDSVADYRVQILRETGAVVERIPPTSSGLLDLHHATKVLWKNQIQSVLVEGGSRVTGAFLRAGLVDRVSLIVAPLFLGKRAVPATDEIAVETLSEAIRGQWLGGRKIGQDIVLEFEPRVY